METSKDKLSVFYDSYSHLTDSRSRVDEGYLEYQFKIFESLVHDLSEGEGLVFNTLFAKVSYLGLKFNIGKRLLRDLHFYRKEFDNKDRKISLQQIYDLGLYLIYQLLVLGTDKSSDLTKIPKIDRPEIEIENRKYKERRLYGRFLLKGKKNNEEYLLIDEDDSGQEKLMRTDNLDVFRTSISHLDYKIEKNELPYSIGLVYIDIDPNDILMPQIIVLQPDYLVDVTAVAETFKTYGGDARYYLINKLQRKAKSKYITIGNIVNYFLDELVSDSTIEFQDILGTIFHRDPLMFAMMTDDEIIKIVGLLREHFANLKRVVTEDLSEISIDVSQCHIEPSFFSPIFGLQGRLDLFQSSMGGSNAAIVELKSGKLFRPNSYGLNTNHYTQTLLYELLIRSVFDFKTKPTGYVLYSVLENNNIRFAPTISAQQKEAVAIRNDIVILDNNIAFNPDFKILEDVNIEKFPMAIGFLKGDIEKIQLIYRKMDKVERLYFSKFMGFVQREHLMAKIGFDYGGASRGQSILWLSGDREKEEHFLILRDLNILENGSGKDEPILVLQHSETTNELANFRKGDIILLYPTLSKADNLIQSQIFKGTIVDLRRKSVVVRLRSRVNNQTLFERYKRWNIEHDFLDSSFSKLYGSLLSFFDNDKAKRNLILSKIAPTKNDKPIAITPSDELTDNQNEIVSNILNSKDYYLLWGPPGTGKTSKIIRELVAQMNNFGEKIMLFAYTNRAVDELCDSIESIGGDIKSKYVRFGSRYSTDSKFEDNLFENKIKTISRRSQLKDFMASISIFVSTVSSIQGKMEIFDIKAFDTLIVDEASQLLEPMLISILPYFKRFILIGDHKQLPAVVAQSRRYSKISEEELLEIGLSDLRYSLFQRMYEKALKNKWSWAYGMLTEQGRMHEQIMEVANRRFYDGELQAIGKIERLHKARDYRFENSLQEKLVKNRLLYFPSEVDEAGLLVKTNISEAMIVVDLVRELLKIYKLNNLEFNRFSIGIVTTFRAQIALIKHELEKANLYSEEINIDTVERYQGSARDVIIYSTCANSEALLNKIVSPDENKLDRKLNVVLTRAKEQFILIGNRKILATNDAYDSVIGSCYE